MKKLWKCFGIRREIGMGVTTQHPASMLQGPDIYYAHNVVSLQVLQKKTYTQGSHETKVING